MDEQTDQQEAIRREAEAALEYRRAIMKVRGWCAMLGLFLGFFGALTIFQGLGLIEAGLDIAPIGILVGAVLVITAIAAGVKPCAATMSWKPSPSWPSPPGTSPSPASAAV